MSKDKGNGDGQKRHVGQTTTGTAAVTMSGPNQLKIKLLEDLHTGAGMAIGELDATQICDRRGRPVIRATHVRGLWRAAADELVALKIVSADECSALFGATGAEQRGRLVLSSLRLGGSISARSVAWTSTARKVFDRSPLEDTLRTIEFVAAGTEFTAELEVDAKLKPALERCVRHTIALGASRLRGAGLITAQLSDAPALVAAGIPEPTAKTLRLRLVLENVDPICLPITGAPDNVTPTDSATFAAKYCWEP